MYNLFKLFYEEEGTSPAEYSIMMGVTIVIATAAVVGVLGQRLQTHILELLIFFQNKMKRACHQQAHTNGRSVT